MTSADRRADFALHRNETERADGGDDHFLVFTRVFAIIVEFSHEKGIVGANQVGGSFGKGNFLLVMVQQRAPCVCGDLRHGEIVVRRQFL